MTTHPADHHATNPRIQCSVCGQWKRLHCREYTSKGGYKANQTFFGGCAYTRGDHLAGDHVDVCDECCHTACANIHEPKPVTPKRFYSPPNSSLAHRLEWRSMPVTESGCHIWLGSTDSSGYGHIGIDGRLYSTHRTAWTVHRGPIPPEMCVLHRCDVPSCINPDHLFIGTQADNMKDMARKKRNPGNQYGRCRPKSAAGGQL